MTKVLLFGATGHLGKEIAKELVRQGYELTVAVRSKEKAATLSAITSGSIIADVIDPHSLSNCCDGFDAIVSALGKSVSINDHSKASFRDVDLKGNSAILQEALKSNVKKFVYVSALHSEHYLHLDYFKVHHDFSEKLKHSGIDYSIIKPPAIFSAFTDLIQMAEKGQLMTMGAGDKKTNPIYEGDLALVCVNALKESNTTIEAGGTEIYTRHRINEIIQAQINPGKKIRKMPLGLLTLSLPFIKLLNRNMYDKFAFFTAVMQHDVIAPKAGNMTLEDYVKMKTKK